jgi:preprotein translocase subunit YajC
MNWLILAAVQTTGQPTGLSGGTGSIWIIMIGMLVLFWVLTIVPQRKQQKQRAMMLNNLKKGDKVITTGGMHGEIVEIDDDDIKLRVADKVEIKMLKSAVARVKD